MFFFGVRMPKDSWRCQECRLLANLMRVLLVLERISGIIVDRQHVASVKCKGFDLVPLASVLMTTLDLKYIHGIAIKILAFGSLGVSDVLFCSASEQTAPSEIF